MFKVNKSYVCVIVYITSHPVKASKDIKTHAKTKTKTKFILLSIYLSKAQNASQSINRTDLGFPYEEPHTLTFKVYEEMSWGDMFFFIRAESKENDFHSNHKLGF